MNGQIACFAFNTITGVLQNPEQAFGVDQASFVTLVPNTEWRIDLSTEPGIDDLNVIALAQQAGGVAAPRPLLIRPLTVGDVTQITLGTWAYDGTAPAIASLPVIKVAVFRWGQPITGG